MDFQNLDPQKLLPEFQKLLLTFEGRIARQDFWIGVVALAVVNLIAGWLFGTIGWAIAGFYGQAFLSGLVSLVLTYPTYCLTLKRSNDLDYPQTYVQAFMAASVAITVMSMFGFFGLSFLTLVLLPILAIAAIALVVVLGFFQGTNGPNRYGPDPLASQAA